MARTVTEYPPVFRRITVRLAFCLRQPQDSNKQPKIKLQNSSSFTGKKVTVFEAIKMFIKKQATLMLVLIIVEHD